MKQLTHLTLGLFLALTALTLSPAAPSIAKGTSVQLIATGRYSDDSTKDVTAALIEAIHGANS